jgi:hypothetical protein
VPERITPTGCVVESVPDRADDDTTRCHIGSTEKSPISGLVVVLAVRPVLFAVIALSAVLAGCSAGGSSSPSGGSGSPSVARSAVSLPWAVIAHPSPSKLEIVVNDGGCDTFTHLTSIETSTAVRIAAAGFHVGGPLANCSLDLHPNLAELTLTRPLAGRHLAHAPLSSGWQPLDAKEVREDTQFLPVARPSHDGLSTVYQGKNPRLLFLEAVEDTHNRANPCWQTYKNSVFYSPLGVAEIKSVVRERKLGGVHCPGLAVGPLYSRLPLAGPYLHSFVIDAYTGQHVPIVAVVHPTKDEIIN